MSLKNFPLTNIYRKIRDDFYYKKMLKQKNQSKYEFVYYGDSNFENERDNNDSRILQHLFKQNDIFIDIGANIGYYSLFAKKNKLEVISIEPDHRNSNILRQSTIENEFDIELYETALSNFVGATKIYGGRQGSSILWGWGDIKNNYQNLCSVNTLDNILSNRFCNKRIILKIDAEGVEFSIIKGAINFLKSDNTIILYVEHGFNENFIDDINPNFKQLFIFLFELGYKAFVDIDFETEVTINEVEKWLNSKKKDIDVINYIFKKN